jgi:hypothetical protein
MKTLQKIKNRVKEPKVQLAIGLAVVTAGLCVSDTSKSLLNYCTAGKNGDCVLITDGNKHCSAGDFWNDCT